MSSLIEQSQNKHVLGPIQISPNVQNSLDKSIDAVNQSVQETPSAGMLSEFKNPAVITLFPALIYADSFVNKRMAGETSKSLLGRAGKLGDFISKKLGLNKFDGSLNNTIKRLSESRLGKYFTNNFRAVPKTAPVGQPMASGYAEKLASSFNGLKGNDFFKSVIEEKSSSLSDATRDFFQNRFFNDTTLQVSADEALKLSEELRNVGIDSIPTGGLFGKSISLSELANKYKAAASKIGETKMGQLFAKGALKSKDVMNFGGGIWMFYTASALVKSTKAAKEAPKGEKLATFAHVMSENYLGMIIFTPVTNMLYKMGGNKYRGMSKEGYDALQNLVKTTNSNYNITKEGVKLAKAKEKLLLKGLSESEISAKLLGKSAKEALAIARKESSKLDLKLWERPLKFAGTVISTGLDRIKRPVSKLSKSVVQKTANSSNGFIKFISSIIQKIGVARPTLKGFLSGLGRFALVLLVLEPLVRKPLTKLIHKIFGEPKAYLEKENAEKSSKETDTVKSDDNASKSDINIYLSNVPDIFSDMKI